MKRLNLLLWAFICLLLAWGSLMYEQRLQAVAELQRLQQDTASLRRQLAELSGRQVLRQAEYTRLQHLAEARQATVTQLQEQLLALRTELEFYRQVMVPERNVEGVVLDQFQLEPLRSPGHYHYRIVLLQQRRPRQQLDGHLELVVSGSQAQQPRSLLWEELQLAGADTAAALEFSFRYFQILEGEILVPAAFHPEGIALTLVVSGPRSARHRQVWRYDWQQLLAGGELPVGE